MEYTPVIFDENTDYEEVELLVRQLFSEKISDNCGCGCGPTKGSLCEISILLSDIDYVKTANVPRYEADVEAAYKLLTTKSNC